MELPIDPAQAVALLCGMPISTDTELPPSKDISEALHSLFAFFGTAWDEHGDPTDLRTAGEIDYVLEVAKENSEILQSCRERIAALEKQIHAYNHSEAMEDKA